MPTSTLADIARKLGMPEDSAADELTARVEELAQDGLMGSADDQAAVFEEIIAARDRTQGPTYIETEVIDDWPDFGIEDEANNVDEDIDNWDSDFL